MADKCKFAVIVEGGLVQSVISDDPAMVGVLFAVIDYDTEGADADDLVPIKQGDGTSVDAFYQINQITEAAIDSSTEEEA